MGLFDLPPINATRIENAHVQRELAAMLIDGEHIQVAYKMPSGAMVFTNKRLITARKILVPRTRYEYLSVPYRQIQRFSVETPGTFDLEAELNVWVSGADDPLRWAFGRSESIVPVLKGLATYVLG